MIRAGLSSSASTLRTITLRLQPAMAETCLIGAMIAGARG